MKTIAKNALRSLGIEVLRTRNVGMDPFQDMQRFVGNTAHPMIFDIGANVGTVTNKLRRLFPTAAIHAFEPSPSTFQHLQKATESDPNIEVWNCGLGALPAQLVLREYDRSYLSGFLPRGSFKSDGQQVKETSVEVKTVDHFCEEHGIQKIDVLKSDTEGYDLEVLRGASRMLQTGSVRLVYFEVNFTDNYVGQGSFGEQYDFLESRGFRFVSFYEMFRQNGAAAWTDALFVHRLLVGC